MSGDASSWLPGTLGPLQLQNAGTDLPQIRGTWDFLGFTISDDPVADTTTFSVAGFVFAGQAQGDLAFFDGTNWVRLPAGTAGQVLSTQGAGANPHWINASRPSVTKSANYQLLSTDGDCYMVLGGGSFTVTLPDSPTTDEVHAFKDRDGAAGTHAGTINGNGHNIEQRAGGAAGTYSVSTSYDAPLLKWNGTTWSLF
jgi:hypothetical protein